LLEGGLDLTAAFNILSPSKGGGVSQLAPRPSDKSAQEGTNNHKEVFADSRSKRLLPDVIEETDGYDSEERSMRQGLLSEVVDDACGGIRRTPERSNTQQNGNGVQNGVNLSHVAADRTCEIEQAKRPPPAGPPALDSLDFDIVNNPYWVDKCRRPPRHILGYSGKTFMRWLLTILIG
jgi:hypothetical protein